MHMILRKLTCFAFWTWQLCYLLDFSYWLDHFLLFTFLSRFLFHRDIIWKAETFIVNIIMISTHPLTLPPVWKMSIKCTSQVGRKKPSLRLFLWPVRYQCQVYFFFFFFFSPRKPLKNWAHFHKLEEAATVTLSKPGSVASTGSQRWAFSQTPIPFKNSYLTAIFMNF